MPVLVNGDHLNRYVAPALIKDLDDTQDNFTKFFGTVNKSAVSADGVSVQKLINDIAVKTGLSASAVLIPRSLQGKKTIIPWMNFTTETLQFNKEELRALMFDKKGEGRKMLVEAVYNAMLKASLHAIAPVSDAINTPVIETSGADDGSGRKKLVPKDITSLLRKTDIKKPIMVLSKNHLIDLQENADTANRFADILIDEATMTPKAYAGVGMVANDIDVAYTTGGNKRAIGAVPALTDKYGSVVIDKRNTIYFLNNLFFTMTKMEDDTRNEIPRTEIRIYGEFIGSVIEDDRRRAVIIDGRV